MVTEPQVQIIVLIVGAIITLGTFVLNVRNTKRDADKQQRAEVEEQVDDSATVRIAGINDVSKFRQDLMSQIADRDKKIDELRTLVDAVRKDYYNLLVDFNKMKSRMELQNQVILQLMSYVPVDQRGKIIFLPETDPAEVPPQAGETSKG